MLSVVNNLSILLKSDVSGRISLLVNAQVLEKCVHLPMSQYDNETTYNRIRFTSEQTSIRCTNLINTVFSIVQCLISFASVVCVLVSFNGIIVIASVVASIPLFFVNKYVSSFWYKISVGRVEKQRYSDVLRDLMLRNDNIKELKLFGSLSYLKSRILNQQTDFFREDQMNRKKFCKIDTAQKAANDFVILLLKLWIIILGIKQRATLGTINLYTSSLDQIQSAIFSFCTQLNTFYEQALYLESLFDLFDMQTEDENCGTPLTEPIRTIEFRHVYFSYPATNVYALKNVSFVLDDRHTYALCPAGLVLLAAARTLGGRVRRGCPKETCWFVLGGAFLLALVLPALLRLLPPWITPARWSDFSYWGGLLPAVGKAIETGFSLNPCAKDVLAKWNTLGLLIAATLANAAAGKLMLSRQQKNSTNL